MRQKSSCSGEHITIHVLSVGMLPGTIAENNIISFCIYSAIFWDTQST